MPTLQLRAFANLLRLHTFANMIMKKAKFLKNDKFIQN